MLCTAMIALVALALAPESAGRVVEPSAASEPALAAEPAAPVASTGAVTGEPGRESAAPCELVLGPGLAGEHAIVAAGGERIATVDLRPGAEVRVVVPAGTYRVEAGGETIASLSVDAAAPSAHHIGSIPIAARPEPIAPVEAEAEDERAPLERPPPAKSKRQWRIWGAPLLSAVFPGLGQVVNREPARGVGVMVGFGAMGIGAWTLSNARAWGSPSFGAEAARLGAVATLTGGLELLYAWQILEAYRVAAGKGIAVPRTRHKVAVDLTRYASVGRGAGNSATYLTDWNLAVMGQVARRFSIGFSDLSVKGGESYTLGQAGLRLALRFVDKRRLWLAGALGGAFQFTSHSISDESLTGLASTRTSESSFAAIPYGQLEFRWFVLDRWSLNLMPRVSAPLAGPRRYSNDRLTARNAVTFEIGSGVGVYF